MQDHTTQPSGLSRRDALRRMAVVGGTLAWSAPVLQTLSLSAEATTKPSPKPTGCDYYIVKAVFWVDKTSCFEQTFVVTPIGTTASRELDDIKTACSDARVTEWVSDVFRYAFSGAVDIDSQDARKLTTSQSSAYAALRPSSWRTTTQNSYTRTFRDGWSKKVCRPSRPSCTPCIGGKVKLWITPCDKSATCSGTITLPF
ncbi:hypothetical protein [Motilibacter aurantiacus]|uniref:hypothetical protein n=1 Tax=Motilibacter aurantiacus TaxID=2714955 RepID=UPI00140E809E|nr:hypothetical protein [Motilibacter aurantiacus]NHC45888.1 hypothetical protein [Motilibacter aurantiacus]